MSNVGLTILDGTHLRTIDDLTLPESETLTTARVLELTQLKASESLYGLSLPQHLKSAALNRLNLKNHDDVSTELDGEKKATELVREYITAIADELKDDPIVISILDGSTLRLFLEDEDDFAMLAENLFTDLDTEDTGKLRKSEIRNALVQMGVEMGIPPFSEYPQLNDILKKHGTEGEEELGQAQFAELLQPVLQELADALAKKHVVLVQNVKFINGSKLRKLLADEKQLEEVTEKILEEKQNGKDGQRCTELIRGFLEKEGKELGLPPLEANEAVDLLYDAIFADIDKKSSAVLEKDEIATLVKDILEKFAEQLDANPVFHDLDN